MKKILLSFLFILSVVFSTYASGVKGAYNNAEINATADAQTKQQLNNATQLATLRINLEKAINKTSKLAISKRMALKSMLNKVKKAEKTNSDINGLLMTIGIILMIVGLVLLVIGILNVAAGGYGYGGGGGLLVLGLILWLVGKFVDL
jgi:hypothetical protein